MKLWMVVGSKGAEKMAQFIIFPCRGQYFINLILTIAHTSYTFAILLYDMHGTQ